MTVEVSVLTPSLNQGRFIEDNILSVRGQEGLLIEHIVQDGGSHDDTFDVLRRFDNAPLEWSSEADRGQSDALNKALTKATGRWIAWQNADDFFLPGGLAALVREGDRSGADVVYGEVLSVDESGRIRRSHAHHHFENRGTIFSLFFARIVFSIGAIIRRSALPPDPWDVELKLILDQEFFLKLASRGARFRFVRYPVAAARSHPETVTIRGAPIDLENEHSTINKRYGIASGGAFWGKSLHRTRKLLTGGYWRQQRVARLRGRDLRWFVGSDGQSTFDEVLVSCYKSSRS